MNRTVTIEIKRVEGGFGQGNTVYFSSEFSECTAVICQGIRREGNEIFFQGDVSLPRNLTGEIVAGAFDIGNRTGEVTFLT